MQAPSSYSGNYAPSPQTSNFAAVSQLSLEEQLALQANNMKGKSKKMSKGAAAPELSLADQLALQASTMKGKSN